MSSALAVTAMLSALAVRGWQRGAAIATSVDRTAAARMFLPDVADPGRYGDLRDVRIVDDRGIETPYALEPRTHEVAFAPDTHAAAFFAQRYVADLGAPPAAALQIRFAAATPAFARVLLIESSDDGSAWRTIVSRTVARDALGDAHLQIALGRERARWWRVTVGDALDVPLANVRITLTAQRHALQFTAGAGRRYALAFDGPDVPLPNYHVRVSAQPMQFADVDAVVALDAPEHIASAAIAPPAHRLPAWLLTAAFSLLVAALGGYSVRLLRQR